MNKLQDRRIALGLTQPQLSEMLKAADSRLDVGMVSRFERGLCLPTEETLKALEKALQADRKELFERNDLRVIENLDGVKAENIHCDKIEKLLPYLGFGKENATSRRLLCTLMGLSDGRLRQIIAAARAQGYFICSLTDGRGYYRTDDIEEIYRQYKDDISRATAIMARCRKAEEFLRKAGKI